MPLIMRIILLLLIINIFQVFSQTTMTKLRKKSVLLTCYLELLLKQKFSVTRNETPEAKQPQTDDAKS